MTNNELLKLAAKAYGIEVFHSPDGILRNCTGLPPMANIYAAKPWNPLENDRDALRLAVKLNIHIFPRKDRTHCEWHTGESMGEMNTELHDGHPDEATRRAIVRAAADIGKDMK